MEKQEFEGIVEEKVEGSWTADELAAFLGLAKNPANEGPKYNLDTKGGLITIIRDMIKGHEDFKRQRLGLKPQEIVIPHVVPNPFKKN